MLLSLEGIQINCHYHVLIAFKWDQTHAIIFLKQGLMPRVNVF